MVDALIAGRLQGAPVERTSRNGNRFVTAKVRAGVREGDALFVNVIAFSASVIDALLALGDGESIALAGESHAEGLHRPQRRTAAEPRSARTRRALGLRREAPPQGLERERAVRAGRG